jgi:hypothetical protein
MVFVGRMSGGDGAGCGQSRAGKGQRSDQELST